MKPVGQPQAPIALANRAEPIKPGPRVNEQKQLENAAEQFESIMVMQMLKTMQSSLENESIFGGGNAGRVYGGLGEMEFARKIAESADFGVKDQLLDYIEKLEHAHELRSK
jgi:Rod binding domain-containing protein